MQIDVSGNSQIVRFMQRMRTFRDMRHRAFPEDVCTFTREFLASAGLFALLAATAGGLLTCMAMWPVSFIYGFPAVSQNGAITALVIGGIGWAVLFIVGGAIAYIWADDRGYTERLQPVASAVGRVTDRARKSLVAEMFRSIKDKTCIRVRVQ